MNQNTAPSVYWIDNPYRPQEAHVQPVLGKMTIAQWVEANGGLSRLNKAPVVCVYQGRQLMRSEYKDHYIHEPVVFARPPQGGGDGGSNPLLFVAVVVAAAFTGGAVAGMLPAAMGVTSTMGMMYGAAIGMSLMSLAVGAPSMPNSSAAMNGSPTYSLSAQGNQARLGDPIPVVYGTMRAFPPFAAQPYTEYDNNEQYLYQLYALTQGLCQIDKTKIKFDDTPVSNFPEVDLEIIQPGQPVTLFHTAVVHAAEAGGQDLNAPVTHGPYIINGIGTELTRIGVDVVFPSGLMGIDDKGDEYSVGVHLSAVAEPIDDKGVISGDAVTVFSGTISGRTRTAVRRTLSADVPAGRYQVRITRTTGELGSREMGNCQLGSVRGYMADKTNYGDITLLAMRVRASGSLSDQSSRKVNMQIQRLIPTWTKACGWTAPMTTSNPAWIFADILRSRYGADLPDASIALDELAYLATEYEKRGDEFNGVFDTASNCWEGLTKVAQCGRAMPVRQGNLIRMVRDQLELAHSGSFSMANVSGLSIQYVMPSERTSDSVKVTYWDKAKDYKQQTVLCELAKDTATNPEEITLFGCTNHEQAWREGMYLAASNRERREIVSFTTGSEGYIPSYGSVVLVNHELFAQGEMFSGYVLKAEGNILTLGNAITLTGDNWNIAIRNRKGLASNPLAVEQVAPNQVRVTGIIPAIVLNTHTDEPSHYMIGQGANWSKRVKITSVQPSSDDKVKISGFLENDAVHTADSGEAPAPTPDTGMPTPAPGKVEDIRATQGGTTSQPVINLSWRQAPNSERYLIEYSTDSKVTWQPAGTGTSYVTSHTFTCDAGMISIRVAGIGALRGEWTIIDINAGGEFATPGQVVPVLTEAFTGNALKVKWTKEPAAARYLVNILSGGAVVRSVYLDHSFSSYEYSYQDAGRDTAGRVLTFRIRAENANDVAGSWGELTASNPVPAVPSNVKVTGLLNTLMVECAMPADTDIKELRVYGSQTTGFEPSTANLLHTSVNALTSVTVPTGSHWFVRIAWVDNWGSAGLTYSGEFDAKAEQILETVIGPDSIETPMLKANAITADKVAAGTLTGREISAATTITAGTGMNTAGMNGASGHDNPEMDEIRFFAGIDPTRVGQAPFRVNKAGKMYAVGADLQGGSLKAGTISGSEIRGGLVEGAKIQGGIIEGAVIIAGGNILVSTTEADEGPGTTRYFYNKGQVFDVFANGSTLTAELASYNYTGDGTQLYGEEGNQETVYANFNRFGVRMITFTVTVTAANYGAGLVCNRTSASWSSGAVNDSLIGIYGVTKSGASVQLSTFNISDASLITSTQTYTISDSARCCSGTGDAMHCQNHTGSGVGGRTVVLNLNPFNYDGGAFSHIMLKRISGNASISNIRIEGQL